MTHDSTQHSSVWESTGWIQICRYEYCNWNSLLWLVPGTWTCFNWSTGGLQAEICPRVRTYRQSDTNSRYERALIFSRHFSKIFYWTMREIVHLQAGQCGNQIGAKVRLDDQLDYKVQLFKNENFSERKRELELNHTQLRKFSFERTCSKMLWLHFSPHPRKAEHGMAVLYCMDRCPSSVSPFFTQNPWHDTPRARENLSHLTFSFIMP